MGFTRSSAADWSSYHSSTTAGRSYADATKAKSLDDVKAEYLPKNIGVRECLDSPASPLSTPIILALDSTGSMGSVLEAAMKNMGLLFNHIIDKKPMTDAVLMAMMFDDVETYCPYPLQVTQFESDTKVADQFLELFQTRNGGGNNSESYHLPLYFAATKTRVDAFDHGRRGYIFTVGDEEVPGKLTPDQIRKVFGNDHPAPSEPLSYKQILEMVEPNWDVFHVVVEQGSHCSHAKARAAVYDSWQRALGERTIPLTDINDLTSVIVAAIEINEGRSHDDVVKGFSGSTALTVQNAIRGVTKRGGTAGSGAVRL